MGHSCPPQSEKMTRVIHLASLKPLITARRKNPRDPVIDKLPGVSRSLMELRVKAAGPNLIIKSLLRDGLRDCKLRDGLRPKGRPMT